MPTRLVVCIYVAGITTISAKGTYEELVKLSGPFKKWHDYKWGNHNTNVALGSDIDTNNSVPDGDNSEISTDMATMAVGTSPTRREQYLREQLDELHELQQKVQLARKPILRSHDDFSLLAGSLRFVDIAKNTICKRSFSAVLTCCS